MDQPPVDSSAPVPRVELTDLLHGNNRKTHFLQNFSSDRFLFCLSILDSTRDRTPVTRRRFLARASFASTELPSRGSFTPLRSSRVARPAAPSQPQPRAASNGAPSATAQPFTSGDLAGWKLSAMSWAVASGRTASGVVASSAPRCA
jgi:hypothetical protein